MENTEIPQITNDIWNYYFNNLFEDLQFKIFDNANTDIKNLSLQTDDDDNVWVLTLKLQSKN